MKQTPIYQLGYFIPDMTVGDSLDMDKNRFTIIENQLYNVYNIFGNGILDLFDSSGAKLPSWQLSQVPNQQVIQISEGKGHVSFKYAETLIPFDIKLELPPGSTIGTFIYYFYAIENDRTPIDKTVDFISSLTQVIDLNNYIGLGAASLELSSDGSMNITVYNDADHGRQEISLFSSLTSLVKRHLHIGGNDNPSPIDLSQHVTGVLSAEHIGDIDLSKVTSGTLDPNRLPQIDHNSLLNIGTLTHAQIDALLAALQYPDNNYRLSDYGIVNRLQIILALKKQSGFLNIDGEQLNSIFYLPYTQLSNFVDNNNTTATIDTGIHRVYGVAGIPRQSNIIKINTTQDFKTALFYAEDSIIFPEVDNLEVTGITTIPIAGTINNPYGITGSANTIWITSFSDSFVSSFSTVGAYNKRRIDFDPLLNLNSPLGLWYDSSRDYLYIADTFNHRIVVTDGALVNTIALIGKNSGSGLSGSNPSEFNFPKGIYGFGNTFYVSDSGNNRIQKFIWQNGYPVYQTTYQFTTYSNRTILGLYEPLNDPRGVFATTYNSNSFLFIADFGNHRVLCGVETSGIYSVTQVLGENSVGFGVTQASLITYTPSTGSSGSSAVFSFSTTLSGTISTIGVTSAGINHVDSDTYIFQYPGISDGLIYINTNGVGGVTTAYVKYGVSTNNVQGFNHPQGLAATFLNTRIDLLITDTDNNRFIDYSALSASGAGSTNNKFVYRYGIGTVGNLTDTSGVVYFERPAGIYAQSGFTTVFIADSLNNRVHSLTTTATGFSTNRLIGVAGTSFGIGDTSLTSGGITLAKPFSYIGIANTFSSSTAPQGWFVGESITQGTVVQADIVDRYNYTIFSQISLMNRDTIGLSLATINEIFPNQSLGEIDCYLIFVDESSDGTLIDFNLSNNSERASIRISNLVNIRGETLTQTAFNDFFSISQFTDNIDSDIIGFGFKWSTNTGWANADYLNLGWYLPDFDSTILNTNYPKVLTYRLANGLKQPIFAFNANRYAQSAFFVFRFDSGASGNAEYDYVIFNFSTPENNGNFSELNFYYRIDDTLSQLNSNQNFLSYSYDPSIGIISGEALLISSNSTGRYIDLIFEFNASLDYLAAPIVSSISLFYSIYGQNLGVIYDTNVNNAIVTQYPRLKWSQGSLNNILISELSNDNTQSYQIGILNTSDVGKFIYASPDNIKLSDIDHNEELLVDINNDLYLSPYQTFAGLSVGLLNPQHFVANDSGGYFIADTDNDRVIEVDNNGKCLRAIQGNIKLSRSDRDFVILGAFYNTNTQQIYLTFSQYISLPQNYITQLSVLISGNVYLLNNPLYFDQTNIGLFKINSNSASATFYVDVTSTMDTLLVNNSTSSYFQIQNSIDNPPFLIPSTGRSDGYDLESETISYNNSQFTEFVPNSTEGIGTILNYSPSIDIIITDPTIFGQNTDTPSNVLLSYTDINSAPPYSNFYSIPIQVFPIYFDNIFKPIHVDYTGTKTLIVTTVGNNSIKAYSNEFDLLYTVPLSKFNFNEKLGGSVYVLDRLSSELGNNLLIAEPTNGISTIVGNVYIYNKNTGTIINQFSYPGFDAVKAIPQDNDFLILLYDRQANGLRSKLTRVGQDGKSNYNLTNVFTKPVSLDLKENNNYYVTDTTGKIGTIFDRQFVGDGSGNSTGIGSTSSSSSGGGGLSGG
jgi:hypothetical protein